MSNNCLNTANISVSEAAGNLHQCGIRHSRLDPLSPEQRSERMSRIRNANTKPEMLVRRLIHGMGYRYRLHARDVPGRPDIVFRQKRKALFVHGCFWHQHGCRQYRQPQTRREFWEAKLSKNRTRDIETQKELYSLGWDVLIIWECQIKNEAMLRDQIQLFLGSQ